jgi:hypothetical protein
MLFRKDTVLLSCALLCAELIYLIPKKELTLKKNHIEYFLYKSVNGRDLPAFK